MGLSTTATARTAHVTIHTALSYINNRDVPFSDRLVCCYELTRAISNNGSDTVAPVYSFEAEADLLPRKVKQTLLVSSVEWAVNNISKAEKLKLAHQDVALLWKVFSELWKCEQATDTTQISSHLVQALSYTSRIATQHDVSPNLIENATTALTAILNSSPLFQVTRENATKLCSAVLNDLATYASSPDRAHAAHVSSHYKLVTLCFQVLQRTAANESNPRKLWDLVIDRVLITSTPFMFPVDTADVRSTDKCGAPCAEARLASLSRTVLCEIVFAAVHTVAMVDVFRMPGETGRKSDDAEEALESDEEAAVVPSKAVSNSDRVASAPKSYVTKLLTVWDDVVAGGWANRVAPKLAAWMLESFCVALKAQPKAVPAEVRRNRHDHRGDGAPLQGDVASSADFAFFWAVAKKLLEAMELRVQRLSCGDGRDATTGGGSKKKKKRGRAKESSSVSRVGVWLDAASAMSGLLDSCNKLQVYRPTEDVSGTQRAAFTVIIKHLKLVTMCAPPVESPVRNVAEAANILGAIVRMEHRSIPGGDLKFAFDLIWASVGTDASQGDEQGDQHALHDAGTLLLMNLIEAYSSLRHLGPLLEKVLEGVVKQWNSNLVHILCAPCVLAVLEAAVKQAPPAQAAQMVTLVSAAITPLLPTAQPQQCSQPPFILVHTLTRLCQCILLGLHVEVMQAAAVSTAVHTLMSQTHAILWALNTSETATEFGVPDEVISFLPLLALHAHCLDLHSVCAASSPTLDVSLADVDSKLGLPPAFLYCPKTLTHTARLHTLSTSYTDLHTPGNPCELEVAAGTIAVHALAAVMCTPPLLDSSHPSQPPDVLSTCVTVLLQMVKLLHSDLLRCRYTCPLIQVDSPAAVEPSNSVLSLTQRLNRHAALLAHILCTLTSPHTGLTTLQRHLYSSLPLWGLYLTDNMMTNVLVQSCLHACTNSLQLSGIKQAARDALTSQHLWTLSESSRVLAGPAYLTSLQSSLEHVSTLYSGTHDNSNSRKRKLDSPDGACDTASTFQAAVTILRIQKECASLQPQSCESDDVLRSIITLQNALRSTAPAILNVSLHAQNKPPVITPEGHELLMTLKSILLLPCSLPITLLPERGCAAIVAGVITATMAVATLLGHPSDQTTRDMLRDVVHIGVAATTRLVELGGNDSVRHSTVHNALMLMVFHEVDTVIASSLAVDAASADVLGVCRHRQLLKLTCIAADAHLSLTTPPAPNWVATRLQELVTHLPAHCVHARALCPLGIPVITALEGKEAKRRRKELRKLAKKQSDCCPVGIVPQLILTNALCLSVAQQCKQGRRAEREQPAICSHWDHACHQAARGCHLEACKAVIVSNVAAMLEGATVLGDCARNAMQDKRSDTAGRLLIATGHAFAALGSAVSLSDCETISAVDSVVDTVSACMQCQPGVVQAPVMESTLLLLLVALQGTARLDRDVVDRVVVQRVTRCCLHAAATAAAGACWPHASPLWAAAVALLGRCAARSGRDSIILLLHDIGDAMAATAPAAQRAALSVLLATLEGQLGRRQRLLMQASPRLSGALITLLVNLLRTPDGQWPTLLLWLRCVESMAAQERAIQLPPHTVPDFTESLLQVATQLSIAANDDSSPDEEHLLLLLLVHVGTAQALGALIRHRSKVVKGARPLIVAACAKLLVALCGFYAGGNSCEPARIDRAMGSAAEGLASIYTGVAAIPALKQIAHVLLFDFVTITTLATAGRRIASAPLQPLPRNALDAVSVGALHLIGSATPPQLQHLHATLGGAAQSRARKALAELKVTHETAFRFKGKI